MPAIVYQTNKLTGITYAYQSVSYWDRDNGYYDGIVPRVQ